MLFSHSAQMRPEIKPKRADYNKMILKIIPAIFISALLMLSSFADYARAEATQETIDALLNQLQNAKDYNEKGRAATELARLKDTRATRGLIDALRSEDNFTRKFAVYALGGILDPRSLEALRQALGDKYKPAAYEAKEALRAFGKQAEPVLLDAVEDKNPRVVWRASELLARLGNPAGADGLIDAFERGSPNEQAEALKFLAYLKEKRALPFFIKGLVDKEKDVRKATLKNLSSWIMYDPSITPPLIKALEQSKDVEFIALLIGALRSSKQREALDAFLRMAEHPEPRARAAAIGALGATGSREFSPVFLRALKDKEPIVKKAAIFGLGEAKEEEAAEPLLGLLKDSPEEMGQFVYAAVSKIGQGALPKALPLLSDGNGTVRLYAVRIVGEIGDAGSSDVLTKMTKDPEGEVRAAALGALGRLGAERACPVLIEALGAQDPKTKAAAASALAALREKAVAPLIAAFKEKRKGLGVEEASKILVKIGPPAIGPLEGLWRAGGTEERRLALNVIGRIDDEKGPAMIKQALSGGQDLRLRLDAIRIVEDNLDPDPALIIPALKDPSPEVRKAAALALGNIGDEDSADALKGLLNGSSGEVRASMLLALGKTGSEDSFDVLVSSLGDKDPVIRARAAEALGELGNPKATPHLAKLLEDGNADVREAALEAIALLGDASASGALVAALASKDASLRVAAVKALGRSGGKEAVGPLIKLIADPDGEISRNALVSVSFVLQKLRGVDVPVEEGDIRRLIDLLDHPEEHMRIRASSSLGLLGPQVMPGVSEAARTGQKHVRIRAVNVLGKVKDKRATPVLLEILRNEKDKNVLAEALIALGYVGDEKALTPITKNLRAEDWELRANAAFALGRIGSTKSVAALMTLSEDPVLKVRKSAREALERITGDSCPLLVLFMPFDNADLVLFILMAAAVTVPYVRKKVPPMDFSFKKFAGYFKFFSNERNQWWMSVVMGVIALGVFAYCVYCEITEPAIEATNKEFLANLYLFTLKVFPFFVGGSLIAGVIMKRFSQNRRFPRSMLSACTLGSVLPICSCGVVPMAKGMLALDIPKRTVIAFLVVTPVLNPFVLVLSYGVIGLQYTILRVLGTVALAVAMGVIIEKVIGDEDTSGNSISDFCKSCVSSGPKESSSGLVNGWKLMGLLYKYIIIGTLLGAAVATYMPMGLVTKYLGSSIFGLFLAVIVGIPIYLCTGEEVVFLKPLIDLGLPMGHAIAFTIAANGICVTSIAVLFGSIGKKTTSAMVVLFLVLSFILGYAINIFTA